MNHPQAPSDVVQDQNPVTRTRVVIVGAGPIGLELAVALTRHAVPFEIVDAGAIGQTISWWAPETRWFSSNERIAIAGVPLLTNDQAKATREQYLTYLRGIVAQFGIRVRSYQPVTGIDSLDEGFRVTTQAVGRRQTIECQAVVLACGGTDTPRRLGIPGEQLPHVDGYLCEPHRYVGRRVLIIGGRNSAVEAALRLQHVGAIVSISYRGEALPEDGIKYWLLPEIRGLCNAGRITPYMGTQAVEIHPDHVVLESSTGPSKPGERTAVAVDDVLCLIGYEQDKSLFKAAGIELIEDSQRPRINEQTMESSVPGIYVAGTAVAGTQNSSYKIFLENCHQHIDRIVADLTGQAADPRNEEYERQVEAQPES